jgi:hypothetical protein
LFLARVTSDLQSEKDESGASDLRILKMKLESLHKVRRMSEQTAVEAALPGVTIH